MQILLVSVPTYAKQALLLIAILFDPAPRFLSTSHPMAVLFDPAVEDIEVPASTPTNVLLKPLIVPRTILPTMNVFYPGSA
jgi:hypothetical protein